MKMWLFLMLLGLGFCSICWYYETVEAAKRIWARLFGCYAAIVTFAFVVYYLATDPATHF